MWRGYFTPGSVDEALTLLQRHGVEARIVAGCTDMMPEMENGDTRRPFLIDISRIPELANIEVGPAGVLHIGPGCTHNEIATSPICGRDAIPLAQACSLVGSNQIRNRGTLAGNIMTASPAANTPPALLVLGGEIELASRQRGKRLVDLSDFFTDYRMTAAEPDELVTDIRVRPMKDNARGCFAKLAERKSRGIAVVTVAVLLEFDLQRRIREVRIALGSVAPTVVLVPGTEAALQGEELSAVSIQRAAKVAGGAASPISDIRGDAEYRRWMVEALTARALTAVWRGEQEKLWEKTRATLVAPRLGTEVISEGFQHVPLDSDVIEVTVNGKKHQVAGASNKRLVDLLRDDLGLIGTKKGCGEGECGACTISLNGRAVMSCLIPAPRAHHCDVLTVEGLARDGQMNELQKSFYEHSSVQCGYCTPGFLVAGHILMQELPDAGMDTIKSALGGNVCRCTGYKRYLDAVKSAFDARNAGPERVM